MFLILLALSITFAVILKLLFTKSSNQTKNCTTSCYEEKWYGKDPRPETGCDEDIIPFEIHVPDEVLNDLRTRLQNTYLEESYTNSFEYGFNSNYLHKLLDYWQNVYQWRVQEKYLNKYPHFKTKIEGIDVHFIHVKPVIPEGKKLRIIPLLFVHGWPGSILEFYKIIPLMITENVNNDFVFEVICPSIPGYGFSESPKQKGFSQRSAARVFVTLMKRLGHSHFYIQGGDWGSVVCCQMAKFYPLCVKGMHLNLFPVKMDFWYVLKHLMVYYFPFLLTAQENETSFPIKEKITAFLQETGYYHIHATKPETLGYALGDSPAGLAAYILEKFSIWTKRENKFLPDGGLTKKFCLDDLLTNVMIYWVNKNVNSSMKFYKEYFEGDAVDDDHDSVPINVPWALGQAPNDMVVPKFFIPRKSAQNLLKYTILERGGHFVAFEEPHLLAEDIWKFVALNELREPIARNLKMSSMHVNSFTN